MVTRKYPSIATLVLISLLSSPVSAADYLGIIMGHEACVYEKAAQLEDGRSDAATVARAVLHSCSIHWTGMKNHYNATFSRKEAAEIISIQEQHRMNGAIEEVLKNRSATYRTP
ncbi:hypothetical protein ASF33_14765 [Methylobacterium sp. Leaf92]|nr:hypothetical protein ASF33_14765 [Methylobacterium sp. Leaf92]